jgi:hypothetical protein
MNVLIYSRAELIGICLVFLENNYCQTFSIRRIPKRGEENSIFALLRVVEAISIILLLFPQIIINGNWS